MKISLIGITEKSAFPRKEINTTSAIEAQNVPIDSACKWLRPLILKYTDQNAAALINIKCPRQVPLEDFKSISQIAIDSAPAIIQSKPTCLSLLGRSPINKKALRAAQNGSVPGAKIPASDAASELLSEIIENGEDDQVEFKSTLRNNLHTGKHDKRMENACLKTIAAFINPEGGLLLVGVDDEGVPLGLENDQFPNHDKLLLHLTSLVRMFLGGEFAPFIRSGVHSLGGKEILAVECLPSPQPVYFNRDQSEVFFVRSGPSTQQLSPSQVVAYVGNRGRG